jgi:Sugar phosphate isomerases/epimerases
MTFELGLSSYIFYWGIQYRKLSATQLVEMTVGLGLHVLQICDNLPLIKLLPEQIESLGELACSKNLALEVGTRGFDQNELYSYIEIAARLGSPILRFVPWSGLETLSKLTIGGLSDFLKPMLESCENHQVTIALENHSEISDVDLVRLVEDMHSPYLGICLDTANSTGLLQKPLETVELLAPYTVSLHLKDFQVTKRAGKGYVISGAPLGKGWLDVPAVFRTLAKYNKQPNVLLELWVDPCDAEQSTLQKENDWIEQSIGYAQKIVNSDQPFINRI